VVAALYVIKGVGIENFNEEKNITVGHNISDGKNQGWMDAAQKSHKRYLERNETKTNTFVFVSKKEPRPRVRYVPRKRGGRFQIPRSHPH